MYKDTSRLRHGGYWKSRRCVITRAVPWMGTAQLRALDFELTRIGEIWPVVILHIEFLKNEASQLLK